MTVVSGSGLLLGEKMLMLMLMLLMMVILMMVILLCKFLQVYLLKGFVDSLFLK